MYSIWVMVAQGGMEGGCALGEREKGGGGVVAGSLHDGSLDGFHNGGSLNLGR